MKIIRTRDRATQLEHLAQAQQSAPSVNYSDDEWRDRLRIFPTECAASRCAVQAVILIWGTFLMTHRISQRGIVFA